MKKVCEYSGIIVSVILPIVSFVYFAGIVDFNLYNWLWCGFYGCMLVYHFSKAKIYKYVIIFVNISIMLFCGFGALMGRECLIVNATDDIRRLANSKWMINICCRRSSAKRNGILVIRSRFWFKDSPNVQTV